MRITLTDCENVILREIADASMKQRDVAQTYALTMRSGEAVDWAKINRAIIDRWSMAGLVSIKTQAHSGACFEGEVQ